MFSGSWFLDIDAKPVIGKTFTGQYTETSPMLYRSSDCYGIAVDLTEIGYGDVCWALLTQDNIWLL
jgi:hypothetical protein